MRNHTLNINRVVPADTAYTTLITGVEGQDIIVTAIICVNNNAAAQDTEVVLVGPGETAGADTRILAVTEVAIAGTVDLISGFEVLVPSGYTLQVKGEVADDLVYTAFSKQALEGTLNIQ